MKSFLFSSLLFLTAATGSAQLKQLTLEEAAAKRWSEMHVDRIAADATAVDGVVRVGPSDPDRRLPHLVCLTVEGVEAEPILLALDQRGVAVHSGSACSSEMLEPSPVLLAMGADADRSLRVSVGWNTTAEDAAAFGPAFTDAIANLRALRG